MAGELDFVQGGQKLREVLTASTWNAFVDTARRVRAGTQWVAGADARSDNAAWYWCKLTSDLSSGSFESPTSCTVDIYFEDWTGSPDIPPLIVAEDDALLGLTVANYLSVEATTGTKGQIEQRVPGLWTFKGLECSQ